MTSEDNTSGFLPRLPLLGLIRINRRRSSAISAANYGAPQAESSTSDSNNNSNNHINDRRLPPPLRDGEGPPPYTFRGQHVEDASNTTGRYSRESTMEESRHDPTRVGNAKTAARLIIAGCRGGGGFGNAQSSGAIVAPSFLMVAGERNDNDNGCNSNAAVTSMGLAQDGGVGNKGRRREKMGSGSSGGPPPAPRSSRADTNAALSMNVPPRRMRQSHGGGSQDTDPVDDNTGLGSATAEVPASPKKTTVIGGLMSKLKRRKTQSEEKKSEAEADGKAAVSQGHEKPKTEDSAIAAAAIRSGDGSINDIHAVQGNRVTDEDGTGTGQDSDDLDNGAMVAEAQSWFDDMNGTDNGTKGKKKAVELEHPFMTQPPLPLLGFGISHRRFEPLAFADDESVGGRGSLELPFSSFWHSRRVARRYAFAGPSRSNDVDDFVGQVEEGRRSQEEDSSGAMSVKKGKYRFGFFTRSHKKSDSEGSLSSSSQSETKSSSHGFLRLRDKIIGSKFL